MVFEFGGNRWACFLFAEAFPLSAEIDTEFMLVNFASAFKQDTLALFVFLSATQRS
jgi:hypothetical protein